MKRMLWLVVLLVVSTIVISGCAGGAGDTAGYRQTAGRPDPLHGIRPGRAVREPGNLPDRTKGMSPSLPRHRRRVNSRPLQVIVLPHFFSKLLSSRRKSHESLRFSIP